MQYFNLGIESIRKGPFAVQTIAGRFLECGWLVNFSDGAVGWFHG